MLAYSKLFSSFLLLFVIFECVVSIEKHYSTKYDGLDVDKILENDRILTSYIKCILDEGACTSEGRELKKILPDALATGCSKCSEKQRITSQKVIDHLSKHRIEDWKRLTAKYDPRGEYEIRFRTMISEAEGLINSTPKP